MSSSNTHTTNTQNNNTNNNNIRKPTLLEEIQEVLPQSYLIFLLADLRLMSGTGRIATKYETLALDSDACPRISAEQVACRSHYENYEREDDDDDENYDYDEEDAEDYEYEYDGMNDNHKAGQHNPLHIPVLSSSPTPPHHQQELQHHANRHNVHEGLSPAQVMAVLLLELKSTMDEVKRAKRWQQLHYHQRGDNNHNNNNNTNNNEDPQQEDDRFISYRHNPQQRRTLEDSMESLLRAYSRMISSDLKANVPHIQRRRQSMIASGMDDDDMDGGGQSASVTTPRPWTNNANNNPELMLASIAEETDTKRNPKKNKNKNNNNNNNSHPKKKVTMTPPPSASKRRHRTWQDDTVEATGEASTNNNNNGSAMIPSRMLPIESPPLTTPPPAMPPIVLDDDDDDGDNDEEDNTPQGTPLAEDGNVAPTTEKGSSPSSRVLTTCMTGDVVVLSSTEDDEWETDHVGGDDNDEQEEEDEDHSLLGEHDYNDDDNKAQEEEEEDQNHTKPVKFVFPKKYLLRRKSMSASSEDSSLSAPQAKPISGLSMSSLHTAPPTTMATSMSRSPHSDGPPHSPMSAPGYRTTVTPNMHHTPTNGGRGNVASSPASVGHSLTTSLAQFQSFRNRTAANRKARLQTLAAEVRQRRISMAAEWQSRKLEIAEEVKRFIPPNQDQLTQHEFEELTDTLFEMGTSNVDLQQSIGSAKSPSEMLRLLQRAVESRQAHRLQFMSNLFKDGSISQLMVQSSSRILWMNDWYPLKDLTYAIAVDQELQRVLVVFRGAITKADWNVVKKFAFETVPNPVMEPFEGKSKHIKVYTGFYQYLFRKRKDTGTTKYDEIANLAHKYGMEKIGVNYNLVVTGHSLGGALTTFFSFYASTEKRFTKNGPVKAFTFGGPYCGGHSFADTFRYQERKGKLQCVRVFNDNDMVPHLPFNFSVDRRGCYWRHVGIGVKLPTVPSGFCFRYICFWKRWWKPRVFYVGKEKTWLASIARGYGNNVFLHFPWGQPWNYCKVHTLFELQDRFMYGTKVKKLGGEFDLLQKPVDELYSILQKTDFTTLKQPRPAKAPTGEK